MIIPRKDVLIALHDEMISAIGGMAGIRDEGLLESALSRPENLVAYEGADVVRACTSLAYGIARNHAFFDGNKRTALLSLRVGMALNGWDFDAPEDEEVEVIVRLAEGSLPEPVLEQWVRDHSRYDPALARLAGIDQGAEETPELPSIAERIASFRAQQNGLGGDLCDMKCGTAGHTPNP